MRSVSIQASMGLVVLAAGLAGPPAGASAQASSTAVAPFEGRYGRPMQRLVERALRRQTDTVASRRVSRAARRGRVEGTTEAGVVELAEVLEVDFLVQGSVSGPRARPVVELVVRAPDGVELARGEARYRRGRAGARVFNAAVREIFGRAAAAAEARRAQPEPAPPEPVEPIPAPVEAAPPPPEVPPDGLAVFGFGAGLTLRTRDARVDLADGRARRYASGPYPELALAAELRPFANDAHLGRGLFVRAAFGHSVGLGSTTESGSVQVDTNFLRFGIDAGWLAPLGQVAELGVGVGVAYDGYFLSANPVLPSAEYVAVRPGARGRIRIAEETVVLELEVGYRAIVGAGALREELGASGDSRGVDVGLQIGGNLHRAADLGLTWAVRFDYVGAFLGLAPPARASVPGTHAEESSVRGTALLGWSLR